MSQLYTVQENTLTDITNAIRKKFNFKDKIKTTDIPLYISNDSNLFWVTHFNTNGYDLEGTGIIFTPDVDVEPIIKGWHYYIAFEKDTLPNQYKVKNILDYSSVSNQIMVQLSGINWAMGYLNDATIECQIPTVQTSGNGISKVVYNSTKYSITGLNSLMVADACVLYTSLDLWATNNPNWSCALHLRPTVNTDLYTVVKQIDYPIETIQQGDTSYIPTIDEYKSLFANDWQTGDIIIGANGWTNYPVLFNLEPGGIDLNLHISIPEDGFLYIINQGNNYPSFGINKPNYINAGATTCWPHVISWQPGDSFIFENLDIKNKVLPTTTPDILWYNINYICTSTFDMLKKNTIKLDGNLSDDGWGRDGWRLVNRYNGTYQKAVTNEIALNGSYVYKIKTDDEYLYVAACRLFTNLAQANIMSTHKLRLWIKSNPEATVYTHVYDIIYNPVSAPYVSVAAMKNNSLTTSDVVDVTSISSIEGDAKFNTSKVIFEFKVRLSEFSGEEKFDYIIQYAYAENSTAVEAFTLYGQKFNINDLPYLHWDDNAAEHVYTKDEEITSDEVIALIKEGLQ